MNPKQYFQSIHKYDLRKITTNNVFTVIGNQTFIRAIKRDDKKYLISNVISFIWHLILKINMLLLIKIVVIENVNVLLRNFCFQYPRHDFVNFRCVTVNVQY